ncbi:MAG: hypothetical protein ACXADY_15550 [Candidatus Hodarchaeales archaeon]|jgi:hypothetical protein
MTTIPDLIRLYVRGFKQLFYYRPSEKGEKGKLSILKIIIFIAFILAFIFTFLQFEESNIPSATIEEWREREKIQFLDTIPLSIYGELALLMNVIIITGIFFFLLTKDKPLYLREIPQKIKEIPKQIKGFIWNYPVETLVTLLLLAYLSINGILLVSPNEAFLNLTYYSGKGLFIVWAFVSPILIFGAILISLDIFAKDYPKLMYGFNKKNTSFFILCVIIALVILGIIATVFNITIANGYREASNKSFPGLEGVYYNEDGLWWMVLGTFTILCIIFLLILIEIINDIRLGSTEIRERRKANFLLLFPFILLFVYTKAFSATFFFGLRLKSLTDIIDLLNLCVVVFLAVFRVLSVQERTERRHLQKTGRINTYKRWFESVPPYCKVLVLFYLAFTSFYATLEANTVVALIGVQHEFKLVRMYVYIVATFTSIFFVFWRYKPFNGTTSPVSNKEK